jgi:hypothetical protein
MVEFPRLYSGRWFTLRRPATGNVVLTTTDGGTTYVKDVAYVVNDGGTAIRLIDGGGITAGKLLKLVYAYAPESYAEVSLSAPGRVTAVHVLLVHRYADGASRLEIELPRVTLESDVTLAFDEKDWIGLPFSGECLRDESNLDSPFGSQKFYGPIFSKQTDAASEVEDNPYAPGLLIVPQV